MNAILMNAEYHSQNGGDVPNRCVMVSEQDFAEVRDRIHPDYVPFIPAALEQMKSGIDFVFLA